MAYQTIDFLHESALLLAAFCISLSVYILARGLGNKLCLAYSALTATVSLWAFSFFMARVLQMRIFETIHLNTNLLIGPIALLFMDLLFQPEGRVFKALRYLAYAVLLLFFPLVTLGLDRYPTIRDVSYYSPAAIVLANFYLVWSETWGGVKPRVGTLVAWREEVLLRLKRRNLWIYGGAIFVTMFCVMDRVPWLGRTIPAIANILLGIYFFFLRDVVLQDRLQSPRRTFGHILANFVAAAFASAVFLLLTIWVKNNLLLFMINSLLASYVAVVSFDPLRRLTLILFERFFFKESTRIQQLTLEANKKIAGAFHERGIVEATEEFLRAALGVPMVSFYALDAEERRLRLLWEQPGLGLPQELSLGHPLVAHWSKTRDWRPLLELDLALESERTAFFAKPERIESALQAMRELKSTIAIPLVFEKRLIGFTTLRTNEPPELWEDSWGVLLLLRPYFHRAAEALRELDIYARLRERDRLAALGEMAAGLAHEIRNPLGAIKGAVQVLDPRVGDKDEKFLKIITEESDRLNRVVSQFLDYAKPFTAAFRSVELASLLEQQVEKFRIRWPECEVQSTFLYKENVYCQPELVGQLLTNLLENARNAVRESASKRIQVKLRSLPGEGGLDLVLSVRDSGVGIAKEDCDKVFIPFFTRTQGGTGLGLAICQRIAEAHGGHIELDSEVDEGTVVTLRMPRRKSADE